jgi:hypothetical protein
LDAPGRWNVTLSLTRRQRTGTLRVLVLLIALGFLCQVLALDHWVATAEAAGRPHGSSSQFCHGSLSNCSGTVDVGSSLHAQLAPPIPPENVPGELDLAVQTPPAFEPSNTDPPPRAL